MFNPRSGNDQITFRSILVYAGALVLLMGVAATLANSAEAGDFSESTAIDGTGSITPNARKPVLKSIALSPLTFSGAPGIKQQLTVTGTYRDGAVVTLKHADQAYISSNKAVATVNLAGLVTVATNAAVGATATISATNRSSGVSTSPASSTAVTVIAPTLVSIALSPLAVPLAPNATQQLTVTGTYNNGSTQLLSPAVEKFVSSLTSVATVNSAGVVAGASGALVGATTTINVTDVATGISAAPGQTTVVTASLPSPTSVYAATMTANNNALCNNPSSPSDSIAPFYWEIGDQNGSLAFGSVGSVNGQPIQASTEYAIASASKMLYAAYVTQVRGAASALTPDINFLNLTSGYANIPEIVTGANVCPQTDSPDTVNTCLALKSPQNAVPSEPFGYQILQAIGVFYYDSGHMEVHASQSMALGEVPVEPIGSSTPSLGTMFAAELGAVAPFNYTEPLMAGGISTTGAVYSGILRNILNGSLVFHDALGTNTVCTLPSSTCPSLYTPLKQEAWSYSMGHWVEDNPQTNGDGAFSSPGEFGFYPWIDSTKSYYGIVSHYVESSAYPTIQCGRLIRAAFMTGLEQFQPLPYE